MPKDVKSNTIRIRRRSPDLFEKFRTKQLNDGISAVIGFKTDGKSEIQSFVFTKDKFNLKKAKEWVKSHTGKVMENFSVPYIESAFTVSGTQSLPPELNNTPRTDIPDNIVEIFPDVMFSNGRVNKEKVVEKLNEVKGMEKFLNSSDTKKLRRLLLSLLKEDYSETLKENGFNLLEGEDSFIADDFDIHLHESLKDTSVRKALVRLIRSGESKNGNHYSGKCLKEAVSLFDGLPIYPNHSDDKRKVEEKVGFYSDPKFIGDDENGEIQAVANIFESEKKMWDLVKEQYNYPNAKLCGFSINAFGRGKVLKENNGGKTKRIVETIVHADSTDIVDNPSAGGKVLELLESVKSNYLNSNKDKLLEQLDKDGEESMDETTLREKHPELVKLIEDSAKALVLKEQMAEEESKKMKCASCEKEYSGKEGSKMCSECAEKESAKVKESVENLEKTKNELEVKLTEATEKIVSLEKEVYIKNLTESVQVKLSDSKYKVLPGALKKRLVEGLISIGPEKREGEQPSNWDLKITEETNYVNECRDANSKLVLGSETTNVTKSTETVKLSEEENRAIAKTVSKVIL